MSRLLQSIATLCPESGRDEYRVLRRSNGVEIFLEPTRVTKTFFPHKYLEASMQDEVYRVLEAQGVSSDRLVSMNSDSWRMVFTPRGRATKPKNLEELFAAIGNVLWALQKLHSRSWMHRDIRWSNVMRQYDGSNSWFLIDFMDAKLSPADASSGEHLSRKSHAPEIFDASCKHTTAVDIWSVGYLIETSDVQWFDAGKRSAFKNELMHPDPTKRPTAMDAIRRLMELKKEYLQDEDSEYSEEEEKDLEDEDSAEEEDMQEENMPSEKCGAGEGDIPPSNKKQRIE